MRPTSRAVVLLAAGALLYAFANQTQIGWLYVMAAALAGTLLAAWLLNRGALGRLRVERTVGGGPDAEIHEGDAVTVRLRLRNAGRGPAAQVRAVEICPLAAPDDAGRARRLFAPWLAPGEAVEAEYEVAAGRRGLHRFPPVAVESGAPFSLFRRRGSAGPEEGVLVYPELRRLRRLDLLDRQSAALLLHNRAGRGTEILSVRPYRSGDPPRAIHWRGVARTGRMVSKEFALEAHPGLALLLDTSRRAYAASGRHSPFEWAVKIALSLGDYALRGGWPLSLVADETALPAPAGPLTRRALLEYLAKAQPAGSCTPAALCARLAQGARRFAAVVLPWPDPAVLEPLSALAAGGVTTLAVVLDPATFPAGGPSAGAFHEALGRIPGLQARLVRFGEDWAERLAQADEQYSRERGFGSPKGSAGEA